jgi:hypothetical protein
MAESKRILALFDVDGTLTVARKVRHDVFADYISVGPRGSFKGSRLSKPTTLLHRLSLINFNFHP